MQKTKAALGLAQKAGKLASGDTSVDNAIKTGKAKLLIIATDVAFNTKKNLKLLAERYSIPAYEILTKEELGSAIGRAQRACIAVLDANFVKMIVNSISQRVD
ncbi:L7Ae/L30e/S12e/Gadd45 family ribosomal protein [Succinispira mobilis]|uniref:L7Ae/L30e/S12e/Gadd45 family ribosomal protein n=1 Tax=Succinispira mobilis TaxID=78120 RepID=UPI000373E8B8|nr:ribosomal L7Ae/L30e/S12e/Gadd45 family protein [Succinispira mobilis]